MYIIWKKKSFSNLTINKLRINGRNKKGSIVVYHRGGGVKRNYRIIDYKKFIWNIYGYIFRIEYDPNRNSLISLVIYTNGIFSYMLHIKNMNVGDRVLNKDFFINKNGYTTKLININLNIKINSIEIHYLKGAQYVRSAGSYAIITKHLYDSVILKLKNKRYIRIRSLNNIATIGMISFAEYMFLIFKKAGYFRRKGWRPIVRGVAKNPIDHPHGGGQGKTSGGRPSVTPYGKLTKGKPTVLFKNYVLLK